MSDARFQDAAKPLKLRAQTAKDLEIISSLVQDSIVQTKDVGWLPSTNRLVLVFSRYCWEKPTVQQRVKTGLHLDHTISLRTKGLDQKDPEFVFNLLSINYHDDIVQFVCSDAIGIEANVSTLDLMIQDITRPWSVSHTPQHKV